ncbi:hypothetical protein GF336_04305 [Candidatus Woesearchaeota archaeon]|nr:hypothetical protein [Candidatus Woesearchaeota archaeon]
MSRLEDMVKDKQIISIVCNQWGDTGKGKFSDYFAANWADVIARGTGGNNAGHTVVINGKKRIFHLLPAGIIYDKEGKTNILGNGMVLDLKVLTEEMDELDKENIPYNNLMISDRANVILPHQIEKDQKKNKSQKKGGIGSTGRGIGPAYGDKILRHGVRVRDLFNRDMMAKRLEKAKGYYPDINIDDIISYIEPYAERIYPFVRNTIAEIHKFVNKGKKISLEGAQGLLLDIEFGTYPYVTSSSPSANGTASGVGLPGSIVETYGIAKFPYMTRVGGGPFPSELGEDISEIHCANDLDCDIFFEAKEYLGMDIDLSKIRKAQKEKNKVLLDKKEKEVVDYMRSNPEKVIGLIDSSCPFTQGVGIRMMGEEYGATTKRPRRTGWTDLVALKYAVGINGPNLILTKADVLGEAEEFRLCDGYNDGDNIVKTFDDDENFLRRITPKFSTYPGYQNITGETNYGNLPPSLKESIEYLESFTGGKVAMISTGPEPQQTIIR